MISITIAAIIAAAIYGLAVRTVIIDVIVPAVNIALVLYGSYKIFEKE